MDTNTRRFEEHFRSAIEAAAIRDLDAISSKLWAAHGAGAFADDQAQQLGEMIQRRRQPPTEAQGVLFPIPGSSAATDRKRALDGLPCPRRAAFSGPSGVHRAQASACRFRTPTAGDGGPLHGI